LGDWAEIILAVLCSGLALSVVIGVTFGCLDRLPLIYGSFCCLVALAVIGLTVVAGLRWLSARFHRQRR
jgi:hypothetical protein